MIIWAEDEGCPTEVKWSMLGQIDENLEDLEEGRECQ